jgi:hypothetical protein
MSQGLTKDQAISVTIKGLIDHLGFSVNDAMDAVLGVGTFKELADEVWEVNNRKAA